MTVLLSCQRREQRRFLGEDRGHRPLVRREQGADEPDSRGASGRQQIADRTVSELCRDGVGRHAEAKRPAVDVERRNRRISRLVDASRNAGGIGIQQAGSQADVAETGRHEEIWRGPALEQAPADVRAIDQRVLRGRGLVIDTPRIDLRAAVQQKVGNRDGLRLVKRLLPVSSARVHARGIGVDQRLQLVEPTEPRRRVRRQCRTVREQNACRIFVGIVEHGVGTVLPVALHVHVGAGVDQHRQHRAVLCGNVRGPLAEGEHRIVDSFPDVCRGEELLRAGQVAAIDCVAECLDVACLEIGDEFRPGFEARLTGHGELPIGQFEGSRRGRVGANRADARERGGIAVTRRTDQILGELALLFEVGGNRGRVRRGHRRPPSSGARVRIMG
ncbi:MAG: hypothetical protein ABJC89_04160 [Acidobacteriota bacterium]